MAENEEVSTPEAQETENKEPALESVLAEAFKAAADIKTAPASAAPAPETTSGNPEGEKTPEQQAPASQEPPENWSPELKSDFAKLAPEGQAILLTRYKEMQADYTKKTTENADARKFKEDLDPIFKAYEPLMRTHGLTPDTALKAFFNAQMALDQDPVNFIKTIAEGYKIDLKTLTEANDKFVDPEIADLKKQIQRLEGQLNQTAQTSKVSQESQVKDKIDAFRNERDASGNPKYPYFDKVANDMARIVNLAKQSGETIDLATAYDKAIRLDDELFNKTIRDREAAALKARDEEVKRQTEEARKKAEGNIKGRNTPAVSTKPVSIEDNLRAAMTQ